MTTTSAEHPLKRELDQRLDAEPLLWRLLEGVGADGLFVWDLTRPSELWMSPRFKALYGYEPSEVPDKASWWQERLHKEDLHLVLAEQAKLARDPHHSFDLTLRAFHKKGTLIWLRCRGMAIKGDNGSAARLIVVQSRLRSLEWVLSRSDSLGASLVKPQNDGERTRDAIVSAWEQANNLRFRWVVEHSPIGKALVADDGTIQYGNPELAKMFGYSKEQIRGLRVEELVPGIGETVHTREAEPQSPASAALSQEAARTTVAGLRRDGDHVFVSVAAVRLPSQGGAETVYTFIDVSQQKHAELQLQAYAAELARSNADLANFGRAAAHDLQTPLRGIRNLVHWLEDDLVAQLTPETRDHLFRLEGQVNRMQRLIDGLLEYARVDSYEGKQQEIDLGELVRSCWEVLGVSERFSLRVAEPMPRVETAVSPLRQVVRNLLDNAIKHHDLGAGAVKVSVRQQGGWLRFEVEDDGPGIPTEYQGQVFEFLQTLKPQRDEAGPGLGLALVAKVVQRAGGLSGVSSDGVRGCTFWFTWPVHMDVRWKREL